MRKSPYKRILPATTVILACLAGLFLSARSSFGEGYLQPFLGVRAFSSDVGDLLDRGLVVGGVLGYHLGPYIAVEGRGDIGFHPNTSKSEDVIDSGASVLFLGGIQVFPMAGQANSIVKLQIGAGFGRAGIAWSYTPEAQVRFDEQSDGIGAWVFDGNAGLTFPVSDNLEIGGTFEFTTYSWDDKSVQGLAVRTFEGNSTGVFGLLRLRL